MLQLRTGVRLESFRLPFKKAVQAAAQMGAQGVEINAITEVKPAELSRTGVRQIKKMLSDFQLSVCCVNFPTRFGYATLDQLDRRIDGTKAAMTMAYDLGCPVVSNSVGSVPESGSDDWSTMIQALEDVGRHGQKAGALLAARTGQGTTEELAELLKLLSPGCLMVDFDPAELLIANEDVAAGLRQLGAGVVHFRARDAVQDFTRGGQSGEKGGEVQLGRGSLDLLPLLALLEEQPYRGFITIDRCPSDEAVSQCQQSIEYLRALFN